MAGSTVEQLQALNAQAVLKFQVGGMLFADADAECPDPDGLVAADGTLTVPDGYTSAGLITTDGITKSRSMSVDVVQSWQTLATVRSDISSDQITFKAKLQELNVVTYALRNGLTLAQARTSFTGAGMASKRDTGGQQPPRRGLIVARDTQREVTLVQIVPNLILAAEGDEQVGRATELQLDATFNCNLDSTYGTDFASAANGPGWASLVGTLPAAWAATTAYSLNAEVINSGGVLKCTTAGTSASTAPTNPAVGSTVTDGTVVWSRIS